MPERKTQPLLPCFPNTTTDRPNFGSKHTICTLLYRLALQVAISPANSSTIPPPRAPITNNKHIRSSMDDTLLMWWASHIVALDPRRQRVLKGWRGRGVVLCNLPLPCGVHVRVRACVCVCVCVFVRARVLRANFLCSMLAQAQQQDSRARQPLFPATRKSSGHTPASAERAQGLLSALSPEQP